MFLLIILGCCWNCRRGLRKTWEWVFGEPSAAKTMNVYTDNSKDVYSPADDDLLREIMNEDEEYTIIHYKNPNGLIRVFYDTDLILDDEVVEWHHVSGHILSVEAVMFDDTREDIYDRVFKSFCKGNYLTKDSLCYMADLDPDTVKDVIIIDGALNSVSIPNVRMEQNRI